jgi:LysM repeat protein
MNLLKRMRILAPAAIAMTACAGAFALDLPGAKDYTATENSEVIKHEVAKGETLYGISHKYGVTADEIIALNPSLKNGVKAGSVIYIPNKSYIAIEPDPEPETVVAPLPAEPDMRLTEPKIDITYVELPQTYTVAVMLPFMLDEEKVSKPANQITDFYKGLLIAADTMATASQKFEVLAYDTKNSTEHVKNLLNTNTDISRASIIIAPGVQDQLQLIADYGAKNDIYVLNNFVVKDTNYHNNAYVLQSNATTDHMYECAVEAFVNKVKDGVATPVILNNTAGKQDKQAFISLLKKRLADLGIVPLTVEYTGNLHASTITEQIGDAAIGQQYAFISTSGSLGDFNKYAPGLQKFKENMLNAGGNICLFGYPEWTTFRSDALELMYKIDTTIYSRFFADSNSYNAKGFEAAFKRWYGKAPAEGVPSQALLGFDTGCYIFKALTVNGGDFTNISGTESTGIQSAFNFSHENGDKGQINKSVYIIHYQPGNIVDSEVYNETL